MDQIVDDAMGSQLLAARLLEALGTLALLVALAGLYSLLGPISPRFARVSLGCGWRWVRSGRTSSRSCCAGRGRCW